MNWIALLPLIISMYHNQPTNDETSNYYLSNKRNIKRHYSQKELKQIYNEYKKYYDSQPDKTNIMKIEDFARYVYHVDNYEADNEFTKKIV